MYAEIRLHYNLIGYETRDYQHKYNRIRYETRDYQHKSINDFVDDDLIQIFILRSVFGFTFTITCSDQTKNR